MKIMIARVIRNHFFLAGALFFALIIIMTFPLIFKAAEYIPGFFSTDESYGLMWDSWRIKYSLSNHLSILRTSFIGHPFGVEIYGAGYLVYLWLLLQYLLSILTTPVLAYNIQVFLNLLLTALAGYMLVFKLTQNRFSAILSGTVLAFCPYQFARLWQHLGLSYNQWIPFVLFAVILLKEKPSRINAFIFFLSLIFACSFDLSIMYFSAVTLALFFLYLIFYGLKRKLFKDKRFLRENIDFFKRAIGIGLSAFIVLLPLFLPIFKNIFSHPLREASAYNFYLRPFEDLFAQSARPLSYFLPSAAHPLFGKFTEQLVGTYLYGESFTEHALYLGWAPLVLAFIAFRQWRRQKKSEVNEGFYIGFFVFLAVAAWFFSQPPWWKIGPIKILMPSFFMYKILPMFRAYCRFGIVVMLATSVLAGFGLKFILEEFKTQKARIAIATLCCGLVLFEFWNWPPYKVIDVSKVPQVYYWLKGQPGDFVIAEYPLDADSPSEMYKFYQTTHEKKIINGSVPGTYANKFVHAINKLSGPKTTGILKWMGVKYVLAHREGYLKTELVEDREELDRSQQNSGLKFIKAFPAQECPQKDIMCVQKTGPIDVYEVIAAPIKPNIEEK